MVTIAPPEVVTVMTRQYVIKNQEIVQQVDVTRGTLESDVKQLVWPDFMDSGVNTTAVVIVETMLSAVLLPVYVPTAVKRALTSIKIIIVQEPALTAFTVSIAHPNAVYVGTLVYVIKYQENVQQADVSGDTKESDVIQVRFLKYYRSLLTFDVNQGLLLRVLKIFRFFIVILCRDKTFGYNCEGFCQCQNTSKQCNVTNVGCSSGCALGWGGSNCSEDKNIIQIGYTNVTASISNRYLTCDASRSIDGNILLDAASNDTVLCQRCSIAIDSGQPWLQLDLYEKTAVAYIRVYGRNKGVGQGQSSNLTVYANNISITEASNWSVWTHLGDIMKSDNVNGVVLDLHSQRIFRYLAFTPKYGTTIMTICEVKLYGKDCPLGHFGDECLNQCHCKDGRRCNGVTGECLTTVCSAGWKGVACNITCEHGEYGENCQENCHCFKDQECATDSVCDPGFHGQNCSRNCHCYNDDDCNPVNGICKNKLCSSGWQGVTCGSQCGIRNFGQDCSYTCNCVNGTSCDPMNGLCSIPDCEKGWQGRNCSIGLSNVFTLLTIKPFLQILQGIWQALSRKE
ncbi:MEG10-like protein [Mya arenaria]|uniref:MEG10-like protein n=1 Tax=Mya arenaria TaxID=6604 RepID=A0ABY7DLE9_MYAAR|nr:MEG10-like protein [Mya arenaria]